MISAIAQAVANLLASGPTLTGTEQIDFGYPGQVADSSKPCLHLYHYEIQSAQSPYPQPYVPSSAGASLNHDPALGVGSQPIWFNVVFALMACDHTALGEQALLSESLSLLLQSPHIPHRFLSPSLRRYPALPLRVTPITLVTQPAFWITLGIPLRPALQISVTAPFEIPFGDRMGVNELPLPHAPP
ncbi:MAG: Pvc16 family protein [Spirulina sp.]